MAEGYPPIGRPGEGGEGGEDKLDKVSLDPQTVAGSVEFMKDLTIPSSSLILGKDGAKVSSAGRSLSFIDARERNTLFAQYSYDNAGGDQAYYWDIDSLQVFNICPDDTVTLSDPQEMAFSGAGGNSLTRAFLVIPKTTGILRVQAWEGTDDTGPVLTDNSYEVGLAAINTSVDLDLPAGQITETGDMQFVRFSGVQLGGSLSQSAGSFVGQEAPFLETGVQLLTKILLPSTTDLDLKEDKVNKGIANGYAPLDSSSHVPAANLPSYVDDVLEFADLASFPVTGETGKIYIALDTNLTYRWSGSVYVELTDTTAIWGNVSGDLNNQTDLQNALNAKVDDTEFTDSNIKTKYENNADTNAFTDTEKTKLDSLNPGLGYVFTTWGANMQNTGRYPTLNGAANGPEQSSLGIWTDAIVPAAGTIEALTYNMGTGDNTTVLKIIKNGAVAHTFTCTGARDVETDIGVTVSIGDRVAIEYDAGMKPAGSFYSVYIN